jgi:hypothetical protein
VTPKDLKESLTTHRKPDVTHVRTSLMRYLSRAAEYGSDKYERANYMRPTDGGAHDTPTRADFNRLRSYLRACVSHAFLALDELEYYEAMHPHHDDVEAMRLAAYAPDTDPCDKAGPSKLPHLCGAAASLQFALEQAIRCGLLPPDPGCPWKDPAAPIHRMLGELASVATSLDAKRALRAAKSITADYIGPDAARFAAIDAGIAANAAGEKR